MQREGGLRDTYSLQFCNHLTPCSFLQPAYALSFPSNNYLNLSPTSSTYLSTYTFPVSPAQTLHSTVSSLQYLWAPSTAFENDLPP